MKTVDQLEDALYPERNKLIPCEDGYKATILDIELDPIECSFYSDDCVHIDTKDYTYITLDLNNLYKLIDLIEEEITLREENN
jgi:hypothetical protein